MTRAKVAKKSTTGGRVSKKPVKALTAKSTTSIKTASPKATKAAPPKTNKPAPPKAAKAPPAKPVNAGLAKSAKPPVKAQPAKTVAKEMVPAAKVPPAKALAPAKVAPVKSEAPAPASTELKLAQRVPATKVSMKVSAKMNGGLKKPPKKTRAQKLEELGIDKSNQLSQKWSGLYRKTQDVEAKAYNMREVFEAKTPILHKMLGWGYILSNKNDRLEVLFKDGIRFLISNYKA